MVALTRRSPAVSINSPVWIIHFGRIETESLDAASEAIKSGWKEEGR